MTTLAMSVFPLVHHNLSFDQILCVLMSLFDPGYTLKMHKKYMLIFVAHFSLCLVSASFHNLIIWLYFNYLTSLNAKEDPVLIKA